MRTDPGNPSAEEYNTYSSLSMQAIPASQVKGRWILLANAHGIRDYFPGRSFPDASKIHMALRGRLHTQDCKSRQQPNDAGDGGPCGNTSKARPPVRPAREITSLPPELVAKIFAHVLEMECATDRLFLFTRFKNTHWIPIYDPLLFTLNRLGDPYDPLDDAQRKPQPMIQQYTFHPSPTVSITRYALVCKAWRNAVYAGFYGSPKNFFHFLLTPKMNHAEVISGVDESTPHCWVQIFTPVPEPDEGELVSESSTSKDGESPAFEGVQYRRPARRPTFSPDGLSGMSVHNFTHPLTSGTAPWIFNATISIRMRPMQLSIHNDKLLEVMDGLVDLLGGRTTRLRKLAVWLHYHDAQMNIVRAPIADVSDDEEEDSEEVDELSLVQPPQAVVGFKTQRPVAFTAPRHNTTARVLKPLLRLRGLREFTVSGLVTEEFAKELTETVTLDS